MKKHFISIIIPTYNAQKFLNNCLKSISKQEYPKSLYEILVIDGGSTDDTVSIAKKYKIKVYKNPYKDAESGKAIGIKKAKGEIVALVDADNELVGKRWLSKMVKPLIFEKNIFGVESPWLVNKKDTFLNQYFSMLKIADPLARRFHPQMEIKDKKEYFIYKVKSFGTPVVGANGFMYRKKFISVIGYGNKFEEVNFVSQLVDKGYLEYAVPKNVGIYHYYSSSVVNYIKKRIKIGRKFMVRKINNQKTWIDKVNKRDFLFGILYNISIIGPFAEAVNEYKKSKNIAWFWHPVISFVTIVVYILVFIFYKLRIL